jgi:hypothetical protein
MRVHIKLLANYRSLLPPGTPGDQISILVPEGSFIESILEMFKIPPIPESVILINGMTFNPEEPLQEDDVICVFPAMAGGQY